MKIRIKIEKQVYIEIYGILCNLMFFVLKVINVLNIHLIISFDLQLTTIVMKIIVNSISDSFTVFYTYLSSCMTANRQDEEET